MLKLIEVIEWLSPTDNLVARQRHVLDVLWCFSGLHLLCPAALTLALLDVAMLNECITIILVQYFVAKDAATSLQLAILHDLIVNVFRIGIVDILLLDTLLALINVDVAVARIDFIVHRQDFLCGFHFEATRLTVDLLLPERDLLIGVQLDHFEFLPGSLHCHFLFFRLLKLQINYKQIARE